MVIVYFERDGDLMKKHMVIYYDVIVIVWWFHGDFLEKKMLLIGKYICYCDLVGKHVI